MKQQELIYRARFTQTGETAPVQTVLRNDWDGGFTWERVALNTYRGTLAGLWKKEHTFVSIHATTSIYTVDASATIISDNQIDIFMVSEENQNVIGLEIVWSPGVVV